MNSQTSYQFSVFRIYLGLYLTFVFLSSYSSGTELWSSEGMVPTANLNITFGIFPNFLNWFDSPLQIRIFLITLSLFAILFSLGLNRRWMAFALWYGLTCLLNRNNMIINPSIHYTGWLLIACVIIPDGEPLSLARRNEGWEIPKEIIIGAWILFSAGYFLSGWDKLSSVSWIEGTALQKIMAGPLGRLPNELFLSWIPKSIILVLTWMVIAIEMICLPLTIFKRTRKWAWFIATFLQLNIFLFLDLNTIVMGMLAFHLFIFDSRWFNMDAAILKFKTWTLSQKLNLIKE